MQEIKKKLANQAEMIGSRKSNLFFFKTTSMKNENIKKEVKVVLMRD